jgi:hypothetical protein
MDTTYCDQAKETLNRLFKLFRGVMSKEEFQKRDAERQLKKVASYIVFNVLIMEKISEGDTVRFWSALFGRQESLKQICDTISQNQFDDSAPPPLLDFSIQHDRLSGSRISATYVQFLMVLGLLAASYRKGGWPYDGAESGPGEKWLHGYVHALVNYLGQHEISDEVDADLGAFGSKYGNTISDCMDDLIMGTAFVHTIEHHLEGVTLYQDQSLDDRTFNAIKDFFQINNIHLGGGMLKIKKDGSRFQFLVPTKGEEKNNPKMVQFWRHLCDELSDRALKGELVDLRFCDMLWGTRVVYADNRKHTLASPDLPITSDGKDIDKALEELRCMIGLNGVKKEVFSLVNLIKVQKLRATQGLKATPISLHLVFTGNPGTGKTTVARLIGRIYAALGLISNGQLVEVDRSGLVAGYVGQTALKVQEAGQRALGGILFVDEAYSLVKENDIFGQEAIDTLLKFMEDHRNEMVVIAAGYPKLMDKFLESNPGLKSRFARVIQFEDYSVDDLVSIFARMCESGGYIYDAEFDKALREALGERTQSENQAFANARGTRNLFEALLLIHANRMASLESPSKDDLVRFTPNDMIKVQVGRMC